MENAMNSTVAERNAALVLINGRAVATFHDTQLLSACCCHPVKSSVPASGSVSIHGKVASRLGTPCHHCGQLASLQAGSANVRIGDTALGIRFLQKKRRRRRQSKQKAVQSLLRKLRIVPREVWGAKPPRPATGRMDRDWNYSAIAVHHAGNSTDMQDPRKVQKKHFSQKFDDIGYHFMIDKEGLIFEGRKLYYKGAHVKDNNTKIVGICLLADLHHQLWDSTDDNSGNKSLHRSLARLSVELAKMFHGIYYFDGHKHYLHTGKTECPGNKGEGLVKKVRERINREIRKLNSRQSASPAWLPEMGRAP